MKKLMYGALFLAVVGIGFNSCEKDELITDNQTLELSNNEEAIVSQKVAPGTGSNGKFTENDCGEEKTGCTAVVTVYGISYIDDLINTSGDIPASMNYFSVNGNLFNNVLTQNELASLVDGSLGIEYKTTTNETSYFAIHDYALSIDTRVTPVKV